MPVAPVAHQVDYDVAVEFVAIHHREPHGRETRLGIVGVHMHDRCIEALREIARVVGGAPLARVCGETDLIVEDDVDRAAGRVSPQPREVEGLCHDPLAGERGVAVEQHGESHVDVVLNNGAVTTGLVGARAPLDHRIHRLEMAGIG